MGQVATLLSVLPRGLPLTPQKNWAREPTTRPSAWRYVPKALSPPPQGEDDCTPVADAFLSSLSLVLAANAATSACLIFAAIAASLADSVVGAGGVPPSRHWMESGVRTAADDGGGRPSH